MFTEIVAHSAQKQLLYNLLHNSAMAVKHIWRTLLRVEQPAKHHLLILPHSQSQIRHFFPQFQASSEQFNLVTIAGGDTLESQ